MNTYSIYTDGAYSPKLKQGGIGFVILKNGALIEDYSRSYTNTTNIKMELVAVIHALRSIVKPIDKLEIYTDSMYVIGCATLNWQRKKNLEYWKLFDKAYSKIQTLCKDITWHHIDGHSGNYWNEYCDKLAVQASKY